MNSHIKRRWSETEIKIKSKDDIFESAPKDVLLRRKRGSAILKKLEGVEGEDVIQEKALQFKEEEKIEILPDPNFYLEGKELSQEFILPYNKTSFLVEKANFSQVLIYKKKETNYLFKEEFPVLSFLEKNGTSFEALLLALGIAWLKRFYDSSTSKFLRKSLLKKIKEDSEETDSFKAFSKITDILLPEDLFKEALAKPEELDEDSKNKIGRTILEILIANPKIKAGLKNKDISPSFFQEISRSLLIDILVFDKDSNKFLVQNENSIFSKPLAILVLEDSVGILYKKSSKESKTFFATKLNQMQKTITTIVKKTEELQEKINPHNLAGLKKIGRECCFELSSSSFSEFISMMDTMGKDLSNRILSSKDIEKCSICEASVSLMNLLKLDCGHAIDLECLKKIIEGYNPANKSISQIICSRCNPGNFVYKFTERLVKQYECEKCHLNPGEFTCPQCKLHYCKECLRTLIENSSDFSQIKFNCGFPVPYMLLKQVHPEQYEKLLQMHKSKLLPICSRCLDNPDILFLNCGHFMCKLCLCELMEKSLAENQKLASCVICEKEISHVVRKKADERIAKKYGEMCSMIVLNIK